MSSNFQTPFWDGRLNRREFIIESMAIYGFWIGALLSAAHFAGATGNAATPAAILLLISILFAFPASRSIARRAHDIGWAAQIPMALFVLVVAPIAMTLAGVGGRPLAMLAVFAMLALAGLVLALCFPKGQTGANQYGAEPERVAKR